MLRLIGNSSCELVKGEIPKGGQLRIDSKYIDRVKIDTIQQNIILYISVWNDKYAKEFYKMSKCKGLSKIAQSAKRKKEKVRKKTRSYEKNWQLTRKGNWSKLK